MIKILVLNVGKSNKGNCALVSSTVRTISNYIPNVQFQFIGPDTIHSNEFNIERWPGIISIRKPYETIISFLYLLECIYINFSYKLNINVSPSKNGN